MNYEEKYKQALERAKSVKDNDIVLTTYKAVSEFIFPELRESEDERIRKEIIAYLDVQEVLAQGKDGDFKEWIAWLEKQGEQKPKDDTVGTFSYGSEGPSQLDLAYAINQTKEFLKQKPVEWSEEDENMRQDIISGLKAQIQSVYAHDEHGKAQMNNRIDWLKSLKPNHWKPSEEQMEAIKYFIDFHRPQANASTEGWSEFKHLESLYNNIKNI